MSMTIHGTEGGAIVVQVLQERQARAGQRYRQEYARHVAEREEARRLRAARRRQCWRSLLLGVAGGVSSAMAIAGAGECICGAGSGLLYVGLACIALTFHAGWLIEGEVRQ